MKKLVLEVIYIIKERKEERKEERKKERKKERKIIIYLQQNK